ncbi:MAG: acyl-CoA/acyl-ACP dehydrogenase [Myxococcales bacterium]|nr:acyl-CoA/acyl-ACP dehydrogenase [Myxococcales bacterium]
MDFSVPGKVASVLGLLRDFMHQVVEPLEREVLAVGFRKSLPKLEGARTRARETGLFAPHMPERWGGAGLVPTGSAADTLLFQDGVSPSSAYSGTRDVTLTFAYTATREPDTNYEGNGNKLDGFPSNIATLIGFDLSSVPPGRSGPFERLRRVQGQGWVNRTTPNRGFVIIDLANASGYAMRDRECARRAPGALPVAPPALAPARGSIGFARVETVSCIGGETTFVVAPKPPYGPWPRRLSPMSGPVAPRSSRSPGRRRSPRFGWRA